MKQANNSKCTKCNSEEFVTEPNQYDILRFVNGKFEVIRSEFTDEECKIFCRECGAEINNT